MRAVYYPFEELTPNALVEITDEPARHLQVVRVRVGDLILLMNGKGWRASGEIIEIQKKSIILKVNSIEQLSTSHHISLAIATPKKEAFEDILKMAVELGVGEILPLTSEYSQYQFSPGERIDRILESALIQSNNPYLPVIHSQVSLDVFLSSITNPLVFFNSRPNSTNLKIDESQLTILIGPEGGFSPNEIQKIESYSRVKSIHLPTPILRAPTAVAAAIGYLLASRA